jgi:phosphate starvation-inducible protein PhoH
MEKGNSSRPQAGKKSISIKPENLKVQLRQSQNNYVNTILENEITFCQGPAGTSKTFTACYTALKLLSMGTIKQIVLCKPIQESGEKLGFLPGDIKDK